MKFWEGITVGQMGELLRNFDQANRKKHWEDFIKAINLYDTEKYGEELKIQDAQQELGSRVQFAEAYFLTFAAAICEKDKGSQDLTLDILEKTYHLEQIIGEWGNDRSYLPYCLGKIAAKNISKVRYSHSEEKRDSTVCLDRIRNYLKQWDMLDAGMSLKDLLDWMKAANEKAVRKGPEGEGEQDLRGSIASLREQLDANDDDLRGMWRQCINIFFADNEQFRNICGRLENGVKQIILTGAPGTGKTYLARMAASYLGEDDPVLVPFHPSYDYTDFVEGLRPVSVTDKDGKPGSAFVKLDGHFKAFCRQVVREGDPDKKYFFLIDEINRADLSKVFGELIFCLESDKRGERHKVRTQYQNLPTYGLSGKDDFADGFYVPENVYIIGTMNDIDRSVESMDFALRRRFTWLEVEVTPDLLKDAFRSGNFGKLLKREAEDAANRIGKLNDVICYVPKQGKPEPKNKDGKEFGLNRQYYISQGQFSGLPEDVRDGKTLEDLFECVWNYRIESLLREYVRGEDPKQVKTFLDDCRKQLLPEAEEQPEGSKK